MASKRNISKIKEKLICINNINVSGLSKEEKEELKVRIEVAIRQIQKGNV